MATYLMFGSYSLEAIKAISAERTEKAAALVEAHGGEVKSGYALLGDNDLVLIVDLPDIEHAMKVSVALTKMLGIAFSTSPAVPVTAFDRMMEEG